MKLNILFLLTLSLISCSGNDTTIPSGKSVQVDSAALTIAVMPTLDCLPLFVAEEYGCFAREGIKVKLKGYHARMDCDTAFQRGRVNAVVTDLVVAENMRHAGQPIDYITATDQSWQLLSGAHTSIRRLEQIDNKLMAITRFSALHMLSDKAIEKAGVKAERVLRIQVNDLRVRMNMLRAQIMDDMFMPEPWATAARNLDAHVMMDTKEMDWRMGVIAVSPTVDIKHIKAFKKAYDMACDTINSLGLKAFATILEQRCEIDKETVDSIPATVFTHAAPPRAKDIDTALEWLSVQRKAASLNVPQIPDSLVRLD